MAYELKPMTLGEILDVSLQVFKEHWKPILGLQFLFNLPNFLNLIYGSGDIDPSNFQIFPLIVVGFVLVFYLLLFPIGYGGVVKIVTDAYRGKDPDIGSALRFAAARYWPIVGVLMLVGIGVILGLIFFIVPGLIVALACTFVYQVVLMENLSGMEAIKRSRALMSGNYGAVLLVQLMLGVLTVVTAGLAGFVLGLMGMQAAAELAGALVALPIGAYFSTVYVVMYFSQRCRMEGYDLQMAISEVEQRQSSSL